MPETNHLEMWTNLPSVRKETEGWHEVELHAEHASADRLTCCGILFPTRFGAFEATFRMRSDATAPAAAGVVTWLGRADNNIRIAAEADGVRSHLLLPRWGSASAGAVKGFMRQAATNAYYGLSARLLDDATLAAVPPPGTGPDGKPALPPRGVRHSLFGGKQSQQTADLADPLSPLHGTEQGAEVAYTVALLQVRSMACGCVYIF